MFVGVVVVAAFVAVLVVPTLQTPPMLGVIGTALVALAGLGARKR
jgi:hypothetical protein